MDYQIMLTRWCAVRAGLLQVLNQFSDEDLDHTPYESSWTVGRIALHIASAEEGWFRHVVTREYSDWPNHIRPVNYPTVEAIKGILTEVHGSTEEFLGSQQELKLAEMVSTPWGEELSLGWIVWHVLEHEIHHRAELSLILGIMGREGLPDF